MEKKLDLAWETFLIWWVFFVLVLATVVTYAVLICYSDRYLDLELRRVHRRIRLLRRAVAWHGD